MWYSKNVQFWGYIFASHRIAGIRLHHRDDSYSSFQRLGVATASSVTSLAVCAVSLFASVAGTTTTVTTASLQSATTATSASGLRADDWLTALYAALVSLIAAAVLSALFRHAAASADDARRYQSRFIVALVSLAALAWTAVAAFLCLVRGARASLVADFILL